MWLLYLLQLVCALCEGLHKDTIFNTYTLGLWTCYIKNVPSIYFWWLHHNKAVFRVKHTRLQSWGIYRCRWEGETRITQCRLKHWMYLKAIYDTNLSNLWPLLFQISAINLHYTVGRRQQMRWLIVWINTFGKISCNKGQTLQLSMHLFCHLSPLPLMCQPNDFIQTI